MRIQFKEDTDGGKTEEKNVAVMRSDSQFAAPHLKSR